jgi:hypothetical protein
MKKEILEPKNKTTKMRTSPNLPEKFKGRFDLTWQKEESANRKIVHCR